MPTPELINLLADYAELEAHPPTWLNEDQRLSLSFYREESRRAQRRPPATDRSRIAVWIRRVKALDRFVVREQRHPRENNRQPRESISAEERQLADWVRHQRRAATRELHCEYQRRRLEAVRGFLWDPRGDQWSHRFAEYTRFVERHNRAPSYRSADPSEKRIAGWAAKQRQAIKKGTLPADRVEKIDSLAFKLTGPAIGRKDLSNDG